MKKLLFVLLLLAVVGTVAARRLRET